MPSTNTSRPSVPFRAAARSGAEFFFKIDLGLYGTVESNVKCRNLRKLTCKGTLRQTGGLGYNRASSYYWKFFWTVDAVRHFPCHLYEATLSVLKLQETSVKDAGKCVIFLHDMLQTKNRRICYHKS